MNIVYVIHEEDTGDNGRSVIGVASSVENADKLMSEYYGPFEVLKSEDIRDSNLIWWMSIKAGEYQYNVWLEYFVIDKA